MLPETLGGTSRRTSECQRMEHVSNNLNSGANKSKRKEKSHAENLGSLPSFQCRLIRTKGAVPVPEGTVLFPKPTNRAQEIFEEVLPSSVPVITPPEASQYPHTDVYERGHMSSNRYKSRGRRSHDNLPN